MQQVDGLNTLANDTLDTPPETLKQNHPEILTKKNPLFYTLLAFLPGGNMLEPRKGWVPGIARGGD